LQDFVDKAKKINWLEWIDFKAVQEAFEKPAKKWSITKKINKHWDEKLQKFWEEAKKLWKEFFKEVKKGKM
jgi:hypothetical protein